VNLPNAHPAVVERCKIVGYLLNSAHHDNRGKALSFESLGFSVDDPELLIANLLAVAQTGRVVERVPSSHGEEYLVHGALSSQTGVTRRRMVRTVWIINP
jgi:hypothetical protein